MTEPSQHGPQDWNDTDDEQLLVNVRPPGWTSPKPERMYNLVVIGGGTAGLISALGCATLGGKVALIERYRMGGDCLNTGCIPSKALIRSSRIAAQMTGADRFGLSPVPVSPTDFRGVMKRLRRIRAEISRRDAAARYSDMGVHVFFGAASFTGSNCVSVNDVRLRFKKAVIAAGARALHPKIPGLIETGFLTNETVFNLTELPRRLVVIGGGPLGCELAQAFSRLGSKVTIVQHTRFLPREEPEASALLHRVFEREGMHVLTEATPIRVAGNNGTKQVTVRTLHGETTIEADEIIVGAGRRPNVEGLELENAGVAYDYQKGIQVDDFLRTSNPAIFAAGDICMDRKFTHAADAAARMAVQNALFWGKKRLSALTIPWCTYTDPEIAHVGLYEAEARARGIATDTYTVSLDEVDRAVADGETDGFVKVLVKKKTDHLLGATIVAVHAGDLISELAVAMAGRMGLKTIADVIHPYPTQAEGIRRVAAEYNKTRLTPRIAAVLRWLLAWRRWI